MLVIAGFSSTQPTPTTQNHKAYIHQASHSKGIILASSRVVVATQQAAAALARLLGAIKLGFEDALSRVQLVDEPIVGELGCLANFHLHDVRIGHKEEHDYKEEHDCAA